MLNDIILEYIKKICNEEISMVVLEFTPVNLLDPNVFRDDQSGVEYRVFYQTDLVTLEGLNFDGYEIQPTPLDYVDSMISGPRPFSTNHVLISNDYLNGGKICKECQDKITSIGARYLAIYVYNMQGSREEELYGHIVNSNDN